ncbi:Uncharacterized protein TCM_040005 [Theobroma cacao]|uniref:Uncharacterized protein n=1 Tax=Theobroma cacao TaxID=3641 RepID=A0A061GT01_THECC|nr:Uncharacterized protein TCM_040005 [Theobroma cacao]
MTMMVVCGVGVHTLMTYAMCDVGVHMMIYAMCGVGVHMIFAMCGVGVHMRIVAMEMFNHRNAALEKSVELLWQEAQTIGQVGTPKEKYAECHKGYGHGKIISGFTQA